MNGFWLHTYPHQPRQSSMTRFLLGLRVTLRYIEISGVGTVQATKSYAIVWPIYLRACQIDSLTQGSLNPAKLQEPTFLHAMQDARSAYFTPQGYCSQWNSYAEVSWLSVESCQTVRPAYPALQAWPEHLTSQLLRNLHPWSLVLFGGYYSSLRAAFAGISFKIFVRSRCHLIH